VFAHTGTKDPAAYKAGAATPAARKWRRLIIETFRY
jgi:hypothetical protein